MEEQVILRIFRDRSELLINKGLQGSFESDILTIMEDHFNVKQTY
jgi:hypothetical protein